MHRGYLQYEHFGMLDYHTLVSLQVVSRAALLPVDSYKAALLPVGSYSDHVFGLRQTLKMSFTAASPMWHFVN